MNSEKYEELRAVIKGLKTCSVALSGGVDSMTLAAVAHDILGEQATMVHAVSAAVPEEASQRVRTYAKRLGWKLIEINSGEITAPDYKRNPANRCYYCKSCLYTSIAMLQVGTIISGTNLDDLSDYRPGLIAAKEREVRHPFVEAKISKAELRQIAEFLGLDDLAQLPASPCLSSRIETGIQINPDDLRLVERIESKVRSQIEAENIRCRVQPEVLSVEIDEPVLLGIPEDERDALISTLEPIVAEHQMNRKILLSPYKKGSAFKVIQ
ncbi:ATP-dependent sacrificial sulfur transferase LarE [Pseudovibrio sp. Tun.PSC04-5.I4]|uniref:ATP-dependent sacrificial sulfur transferase LarE n=1 Tax=Pseudovibrio sp. Tun.PSC04-5.I4 TaxID=1798213 RepID=UPI000885DE0B|nr:ATP-dependent sacrificial sulfur transferase LarE [Pseudovibrio sp. Tun.PSC04-5.I4]SDR48841.1 uncharacterized protein SAMN04515695_6070 [Pseudovibrio sp. Tun.PSC04-5.I4]